MIIKDLLADLKENGEELARELLKIISIIPGILNKDIVITFKDVKYEGVKIESVEFRICKPLTEKE